MNQMISNNIRHLLLTITIILSVFLGSCKKSSENANENIVRTALTSKIDTLDPAVSYDAVSWEVIFQIYETLFEWDYLKRPYSLRPSLASEMPKIENNGTKYTFKILPNILYHHHLALQGVKRTVKAEDFLNAIKRQAFVPTRGQGYFLFEGKVKGIEKFRETVGSDWGKFSTTSIEGIKIIDDLTFSIELNAPFPQMLYAFSMTFTSPVPIEVLNHHQNNLTDVTIGTGPFVLEKYTNGHSVQLVRNNDYRQSTYPDHGDHVAQETGLLSDAGKSIPFIKGIDFQIQTESNTRWLNFQNKNIDFVRIPKDNFASAIGPNGDLTDEMKKQSIKLNIETSLTAWWMAFNMKDPILGKNKALRQAISHAIDVDRFIQLFTNNVGMKANSIYMPGVPGYNPTNSLPHSYDVAKAKEFLSQAGFPDGKGLPEIRYDSRNSDSDSRQMAEFFRGQLEKIGIRVKIEMNSYPAFLEKMRNGQLQFWMGGWTYDYPDAENILQLLLSRNSAPAGINDTMYANAKVDSLFEELKLLPNEDQKFALMSEIEKEIVNDLPWMMLYYRRSYSLYHGYVKNFRPSDLVNNFYKYLKLEPR